MSDELTIEEAEKDCPSPPEDKLLSITAEQAEKEYSGPSGFVHLHTHTIFSILDGVAQPEDYFKACVDRDWPAVAITEHGVFSSIPDAYFASKEHKIKYIVGCEFYYNDYELLRQKLAANKGFSIKDLRDKDFDFAQRLTRNRHLTVVAKNMTGYENLLKINRFAYENGFYYKPRVWFDNLAKHKEGLIVLSGCLNGPLSHELRQSHLTTEGKTIDEESCSVTGVVDYIKQFKSVFGEDYYVELQMPGIEGDVDVFKYLITLADEFGIKPVITNDSHYMDRKDFELQRIMMAY